MRVVQHPLFANLDFKAAEERLRKEGKGAGEVLIRPSSRGSNYLTITWAFQENWFKHINVEEKDKRAGDLGLGAQLFVLEEDVPEPFQDLDEVFARYVEPMNDLVSVMVKHRSFMPGSVQEVEKLMLSQREERPQRIPYFFRFEPEKPGSFSLTWLSLNLKSEAPVRNLRIEVRPYGLKVRGETFARPSDLIVWFKSTQEAASVAAVAAASAAKQKARQAAVRALAVANHAYASSTAASAAAAAAVASTAASAAATVAAVSTQRKSRFEQLGSSNIAGSDGSGIVSGAAVGSAAPPLPPVPPLPGQLYQQQYQQPQNYY